MQPSTRISPAASFASASSTSAARPSNNAPPTTPARWPPLYSCHGSRAPDVRTVERSNPGTTSASGATSTSTGSAETRRSTASAFACSAVAPTVAASGERLVIPLLHELELLPLAVDRRVEALRVFRDPDLRTDEEVVGIERERLPPRRERAVEIARVVQPDAAREELERARLHPLLVPRRLRVFAGEEAVEVPTQARVAH